MDKDKNLITPSAMLNESVGQPAVSFDFAEKTEKLLRICDVCLRYRDDTILFVTSSSRPHNWNCICDECLERLRTKVAQAET